MAVDLNDPNILEIIQQMMEDGTLEAALTDYDNTQKEIDQQMELADQLRQPMGGQHITPFGTMLGGLANAAGAFGGAVEQKGAMKKQTALGESKTQDAMNRMKALEKLMRAKQNPASVGIVPTDMSDEALQAELAAALGGV